MTRNIKMPLFACLIIAGCSITSQPPATATVAQTATSLPQLAPATETPPQATSGAGWQLLDLNDVLAQSPGGIQYTELLDRASMSLGIYDLPPGAIDPHTPHRLDEVIYIVQGEADLRLGDEVFPVGPGSVAYVRAGVSHSFENIRSYLRSIVLFSKVAADDSNDEWAFYTVAGVLEARNAGSNVWQQFLTQSTMRFGMYMLPEALDGDTPLTHTFDEINIVVNGSGIFRVGDVDVPIEPGSIIFVEAGLLHNLHSLEEDIDVLIFWEGR